MWYSVRNLANKVVEIDIEGVIGDGWFNDNNITMEQVNNELKDLKAIDADLIKVNIINSPGGSVLHGLGIIDILNGLSAKKEVHILGMAASMAAVITTVAKTADIYMTPNSFFLIHRLRANTGGTIKKIESDIEFYKKNEKKLTDLLVKGTGKDVAEIEEFMDENNGEGIFYTAQETKANGFIGKVEGEEPESMAAFVEDFQNLPPLPKNLKITTKKNIDMETMEKLIEKIVAKVTTKVTGIFTNKNKAMEKVELNAIVKNAISQEVEDEVVTKDNEIKSLKEKIVSLETTLEAERGRKVANKTNINSEHQSDPDPVLLETENLGRQFIKKLSYSERMLLNKANKVKN